MAQWLRHRASTAGCTGSIPGWGIKSPQAGWRGRKIEGKKKKKITLLSTPPMRQSLRK